MGPAYEAAAWESFAVAEVGAAAALAGLLVVAASINLKRILAIPTIVARLGGGLALFTSALICGIVLLVPELDHRLGGPVLALSGIAAGAAVILPRSLRGVEPAHRGSTKAMTGLAMLAAGLIALSGVAYGFQSLGGLYWLAPGIVLAFVVGLGNSWVAMIEILR